MLFLCMITTICIFAGWASWSRRIFSIEHHWGQGHECHAPSWRRAKCQGPRKHTTRHHQWKWWNQRNSSIQCDNGILQELIWECFCYCGIIVNTSNKMKYKMIRALNEHYILTVHLSFLNTDVNLNFIIIFILIQMPTVQKYYIIKLTFSIIWHFCIKQLILTT